MRLTFATQKEAQDRADKFYADMQGHLEPGTVRWAIPYQDLDKDGKPIGTDWYVTVDQRVLGVMVGTEKTKLGFFVDVML